MSKYTVNKIFGTALMDSTPSPHGTTVTADQSWASLPKWYYLLHTVNCKTIREALVGDIFLQWHTSIGVFPCRWHVTRLILETGGQPVVSLTEALVTRQVYGIW